MKQYIIIGNSAAGIAALEAIRQRDKASKITVVSDEDYPAYCRCLISYYLAQDVKEDKILYRTEAFYKDNNVELILNKKAVKVDPKKNRLSLEDKTQLGYDYLLIATGSSPTMPQIKGIQKQGVFGFRTIKDAKDIEGLLPITKSACVLGGGLIGLKAAYALSKRGVELKVIVRSKQLLSQMLDFDSAAFVQRRLEENGIEVILEEDVDEIIGNGHVKAIKLEKGKALGCSLVIVAKGVSSNIGLVKESPVKFNRGIIADDSMRTNIDNIYTAGDACESFDLILNSPSQNALWPVAVEQGKIAGANMAGDSVKYSGSMGMNALDFFGMPVMSLGLYKTKPEDKDLEELKFSDKNANIYKKIIIRNNIIAGAVLAGDVKNSGLFLRLIREKIDVSAFKSRLLESNFSYPDIMDFVEDKEKMYSV